VEVEGGKRDSGQGVVVEIPDQHAALETKKDSAVDLFAGDLVVNTLTASLKGRS
jgi:hypothetical protein